LTIADRLNQLALGHPAATVDVEFLRPVVKFLLGPAFQRLIRIPRRAGGLALRLAGLPALLVDRPGGDFFRPVLGAAALQLPFLDVLVLPLPFIAPCLLRHVIPPVCRSTAGRPGPQLTPAAAGSRRRPAR